MRLEVEGDESSKFLKKTLTTNLNNFHKNVKNEKTGENSRVETLTFYSVCHKFASENKAI